ncbi:MAG: glutamate--cysteine ligase [Chromatiales bacterium]|nr:glutamate--cysteine ligase [Chromatiales bacterium]
MRITAIYDTVPNLTTRLNGPLLHIESEFLAGQAQIETWLRREWQSTPAPFYASVDLRNAGFKLAPVDTNLFPAGFNNLAPELMPLSIQAVQSAMEHQCPDAVRALILAEDHTRNRFYFESLHVLQSILHNAGYECRIAALRVRGEAETIALDGGRQLRVEALVRSGNRVVTEGFDPCVIVLNNDLAGGIPDLLQEIEQTIVPAPELGWASRRKSEHFAAYAQVCTEFARQIDLDPWLIQPVFRDCGEIDFMKRTGEDCLARNVETILAEIKVKYREYGVDREPFVVVKSDAGTYGMGVMMVRSPDEVLGLNRRQRTQMASAKGGRPVDRVILQEGVYTFEGVGTDGSPAAAEPVIYMIDRFVVGGFYRVHTRRGDDENLNAPGMHFEPLAFAEPCTMPNPSMAPDAGPNRFYAYGVVARLAALAAAREAAQKATARSLRKTA